MLLGQDRTSLDCGLEGLTVSFYSYFNYRKIVDRIDSDGDGLVTTEELKVWIKRVQKRYIYDNVAKVWKDYDRDKDEKISWEEYKQATYGYYLGKTPQWGTRSQETHRGYLLHPDVTTF